MNHVWTTKNGQRFFVCMQLLLLHLFTPITNGGFVKREIVSDITNFTSNHVEQLTTVANLPDLNKTIDNLIDSKPQHHEENAVLGELDDDVETTVKYIELRHNNSALNNHIAEQHVDTDIQEESNEDDDNTTTEEYHFDLNRYTSDYNNIQNGSTTPKQTQTNAIETDLLNINANKLNNLSHNDYANNFDKLTLTTPITRFFDEKHKQYEDEKNFEKEFDDSQNLNHTKADATQAPQILLDNIIDNSTTEKNTSIYYNSSKIESTNYDSAANEIKNSTIGNGTSVSEKRGKFLLDPKTNVNLTIPNSAEVWALASMKNVDHKVIKEGEFYNVTSLTNSPSNSKKNETIVMKQLADWVEVMKNNVFNNDSYGSNETVTTDFKKSLLNESLPNSLLQDSASQENQIIAFQLTTIPPPVKILKADIKNISTSVIENKIDSHKFDETITDFNSDLLSKGKIKPADTNEVVIGSTVSEFIKNIVSHEERYNENVNNPLISINVTKKPHVLSAIETTTANKVEDEEQTTISDNLAVITSKQNDVETETTTQNIFTTTVEQEEKSTHVIKSTTEIITTTNVPSVYTTVANIDSITTDTNDNISETTVIPIDLTTKIIESTETESETININKNQGVLNGTEHEILQILGSTIEPVELKPTIKSSTKVDNSIESNSIDRITSTKEPTSEVTTNIKLLHEYKYSTSTDADKSMDSTTTVANIVIKNQSEVIATGDNVEGDLDDEVFVDDNQTTEHTPSSAGEIGGITSDSTDVNAIIATAVSIVGVICLILLVGFLVIMRKRQKQLTYGQRCRPVGLDAYSLDNVSVYNSVRRKGVLRTSKRSYGNAGFDDPSLKNNLLTIGSLASYVQNKNAIYEEFKELPTVIARSDEVPAGCEIKNRYANVVPLPETRVYLKRQNDDDKSEYINANYVKGPKDHTHQYIACQAPLETTITDFWRMIWEQNSRVIIMATDLTENGIEKCAEYLPPSVVLENHVTFGDFQVTLKNREVKDKYAVSTIHLQNVGTHTWREITHLWYQWPETGVPNDEATVVAMLLEARSYLKMAQPEQSDGIDNQISSNGNTKTENGDIDKTKSLPRVQGPLTVHCSPGTGRTGAIIACDIALRALELPTRSVDIPQIVYFVRRGRASAVLTREQYEFIYKVANMYATKLTEPITEN